MNVKVMQSSSHKHKVVKGDVTLLFQYFNSINLPSLLLLLLLFTVCGV